MFKKLIILVVSFLYGISLFANSNIGILPPIIPGESGNIGVPELPNKNTDDELTNGWRLQKNYTALLESKLNVFVPLEILSDIDISAVIIDDDELNIPFEIELNKKPERNNYYQLKFSETEIDIDNDGKIDVLIYSPKYINQKILKDNYVLIKGKNISTDGDYYRKVYITIEVDE